jgi:hypothetical protein
MPIQQDFSVSQWSDTAVTLVLNPPANVGGLTIEMFSTPRLGGSDRIFTKSVASGYNAVSGIDIINSGEGIMSIRLDVSKDFSGRNPGNYAWKARVLTSGLNVDLGDGIISVNP